MEVIVDPTRDESLIFELLDLKNEVADHESATWFLRDLAVEQDATDNMVLEHSGTMELTELTGLHYGNAPPPAMTAVGQLSISKGKQGRGAENIVQAYLANIRQKNISTDVLITAYEPLLINPLSERARTVGAGITVPAVQSGCLPVQESLVVYCSLSEIARTVGAGIAVPAEQSGCVPVQEVFRQAVTSFKVHDWNFIGAGEGA
ncbi:ran guanine nucleotide release factor isoform X1 [Carex littledalei]|uniref:Ran guanine nucleotide release factor isoform X1 n=1 Tax=Carex littledalei TaxID=544730 RepID=A0A833VRA5_9POAL|nr:ran guanine nucleotide release factor isoform X1 [Carex littledalei]